MNSVLIIDDEEIDYIIHSKIIRLGKLAEKIEYRSSAKSALDYLKEINEKEAWPTHILLDINMPEMNGFDFVEAYTQLSTTADKETKIYILSSSINPKDKARAQGFPVIEEYLEKPLTIDTAKRLFEKTAV